MTQTEACRIAADIKGASDLYAALRKAGAEAGREILVAEVVAALLEGDAKSHETAVRLVSVDRGLLRAVLRKGAGLPAVAGAPALRDWLRSCDPAPLFLPPLADGPTLALLTNGQHPDMPAFSDRAFDGWFAEKSKGQRLYGLGPYFEKRNVYASAQFADVASPERRTVHLGVDVFAPAGTPVYAPLPGIVRHLAYNADPLDYGHTLILEHSAEGAAFFTLYGHLGASLPALLSQGDQVEQGQLIAHLGDWHENGGWSAHVHFQVMTSMLDQNEGNFFGVGQESLKDVWADICLDPNLILRLPAGAFDV